MSHIFPWAFFLLAISTLQRSNLRSCVPHLSHPTVLGVPLLTSTHPRAGAIPTPSGNHLLLMTRVSKATHLRGSAGFGPRIGFLFQLSACTALLLQIKPLQLPQTPTQPGPPTTHTTTSSPQAPCPAPHLHPQPHLPRASPLSPHLLASQTTLRPGKSITKRSVSVWASAWTQISQKGRRGHLCPLAVL